jgi:predicted alpha/beta-fold hydrolase
MAAGQAIDRGLNRVYSSHFLHTLKPKALAMAQRFPDRIDAGAVARVRSMWAFDDVVTSRLHGFADTEDYWTRASCKPWLESIRIPTLVLNARNDPFVPGASLPGPAEVSGDIVLEQPPQGGHVGFMTGPVPGRLDWLPSRLLAFLVAG